MSIKHSLAKRKKVVIESRATGEQTVFDSIQSALKHLKIGQALNDFRNGVSRANIEYRLISVGDELIDQRTQDNIPVVKKRGRPKHRVKVRNIITGEVSYYASHIEAAEALGSNPTTIFNRVHNIGGRKNILKDYDISY